MFSGGRYAAVARRPEKSQIAPPEDRSFAICSLSVNPAVSFTPWLVAE
jgi:hypothetical protein